MEKDKRKSMWNEIEEGRGAGMPGKTPPPQSILDQLRVAERKKRRKRDWEKQPEHKTTSFRGIPPDLHTALKEVASELQVVVDDVARAFLEFSLQSHRAGRLTIYPVLHQQRMTLFPDSGIWSGKRQAGWVEWGWNTPNLSQPVARKASHAASIRKSCKLPVVSYRRLPAELVSAIRELHQENHVPIGEVVTLFLTYALAAYRSGNLVLYPQPREYADAQAGRREGK